MGMQIDLYTLHPGFHTQILTASGIPFESTYKCNFAKLKKSFRSLSLSEVLRIFQIFEIPLGSVRRGQANYLDFFVSM